MSQAPRMTTSRGGLAFVLLLAAPLATLDCGRADLLPEGTLDDVGMGASAGVGPSSSGAGATGNGGAGGSSSGGGPNGGSSVGGSSVGGSSVGGSGGATQVCNDFGTACTVCLAETCSDTWCDCVENNACLQIFGCYAECSDETCTQACNAAWPGGISDAYKVSDCAGTACDASCDFGMDLPDCTDCLLDQCEDEANACFSVPQCTQLLSCLTGCPQFDLTCQEDCYDQFGAGTNVLEDLLMCANQDCPNEC